MNTESATIELQSFVDRIPQRLANNLAALRRWQPDVAAAVESAPLPSHEPAMGRDGSLTFRILEPEGTKAWFGGSSMPRISSAAMFGGFTSDGASVALPSVATGMEAGVLLNRMPPHAALFVLEPSPALVHLAMCLHEYQGFMEAGRLVWLPGTDPGMSIVRFLDRHEGYELPGHVARMPQCTPQAIARLQRELEGAAVEVGSIFARTVKALSIEIDSAVGSWVEAATRSDKPRVVVVAVDPRETTMARAESIRAALSALNWPFEFCVPDAPSKCHSLARLRAIMAHRPDFVLFLGGCSEAFRAMLPGRLAVVSWCAISGHTDPNAASRLRPRDLWCVDRVDKQAEWVARGMPEKQVMVLDVGIDETRFASAGRAGGGGGACGSAGVAMLIDPPEDRPESSGVSLVSHLSLWRCLQEVVDEACDEYTYESADAYLQKAESRSEVRITDDALRDRFRGFLRNVIAPARVARAMACRLGSLDGGVDVWGTYWAYENRPGTCRAKGPIPIGAMGSDAVPSYRIAVLGYCVAGAVEWAMQLLAAGVQVACRGAGADVLAENPDRAALVRRIRFYNSLDELADIVEGAMGSASSEGREGQALRSGIVAEYGYQARLRRVVERLEAAAGRV